MLFYIERLTVLCLSAMSMTIKGITGLSYTTSYLGCYTDDASRIMGSLRRVNASQVQGTNIVDGSFSDVGSSTTPLETCAFVCSKFRLPYLGLQSGFACFCSGDGYDSLGILAESSCHKDCLGNPSVKCGADYANSVYKINYVFENDGKFFLPEKIPTSLGWLGIDGSESIITNVFKKFVCAYKCSKLGTGCFSFKFNATLGLCYLNKYLAVPNAMEIFAKP